MNPIIEQMLTEHETTNLYEKKNAVKEVVQEAILCGLSRAGFFKYAAFYGGTALRIFYGLDRFSEDLDFSLRKREPDFHLEEYFPVLEKEIQSFGLQFHLETKEKTVDTDIQSAFLKGGTKEHILLLYPEEKLAKSINPNELIKIKFEIDTNPPEGAQFENRYRLLPIPYEITLYDPASLFAGKIHAVICRAWKNRVKGRDLYDYVFYRSRSIPVNLPHLTVRLRQSGYIDEKESLSIDDVKEILNDRFGKFDYEQAKEDVLPFIRNPATLDVWRAEFFREITAGLKASE